MATSKMTTEFAEIFRAMSRSEKKTFFSECLDKKGNITAPAIQSWAYNGVSPLDDIKIKRVHKTLRKMGIDMNPATLFEKKPKNQPAGNEK